MHWTMLESHAQPRSRAFNNPNRFVLGSWYGGQAALAGVNYSAIRPNSEPLTAGGIWFFLPNSQFLQLRSGRASPIAVGCRGCRARVEYFADTHARRRDTPGTAFSPSPYADDPLGIQ